jgi:hypothetical protein
MPREVIHDDTPIVEYSTLCQCATHAPAYEAGDIGGRAWVDHDVLCDQNCPSVMTDAHPTRNVVKNSDQSTPMAIEVRWGREMDVQIATIDLQARDGNDVWLERALSEVRAHSDKENDAERAHRLSIEEAVRLLGSRAGGLYLTLDRDHINKLIKVLKRARDQAYGADE